MTIRSSLLTAAVLACAVPALGADKRAVAIDWIRQTAIPLTSVEAGHGFEDLQPLKKIIGNARLVSLGEATHGSREIFQLKHRMIEFLATEMGFTIFAMESNMPEAYRLNDYVLKGEGDPAALLKGMYFWTWDTEEVLAMIRWMREFNRSGKGRIEFTGFDMQTPDVAAGIVRTFAAEHDAAYAASLGEASAMASAVAAPSGNRGGFGVATGTFPIEAAAGKKVRFSGYIKTREIAEGWAGLWWRVDGKGGILAFDNMQDRGAKGTTDWTRYDLELPVGVDVTNINFGLLMPGSGTAWFDDLSITLDDKPFEAPESFDLGFESETPIGFRTGGSGFEVGLDAKVAHGGKQSLRMTRVATAEAPPAEPAAAAAKWKEILAHLEAGRAGYAARGAAATDIDWAVQNAHVVLQSMQMKSGEVDRDRSMAENVVWILDHNPGAKVVLWAHDGHVARKGYRDDSMGAVLDARLDKGSMVVLGSAFNQGSFRSILKGGGYLKTFTLPAAPPDSLDGTLAAAGIPVFALDLRVAPPWFRKPRASRQLGAIYNETVPDNYLAEFEAPKAYDAVLFIDKTTVARANPAK